MKLGFIGCGKMAAALVNGVLKSGLCKPADIVGSDVHGPTASALAASSGIRILPSNADVAAASDTLILAVKPHDALAALQTASGKQIESNMRWATASDSNTKLLISIVAGLPLATIEPAAAAFRVIRAMPNTPALILQGASAFSPGTRATAEDTAITQQILGSVGLAVQVKETLLDAVTGLSGSGPAYIFTIIEALADGGVLMGLPRDLAVQLAAQTVAGAGLLVAQTGQHPAALRDQVASPGGTTIAGIEALEKMGARTALIAAVRAATERSRELGAGRQP